MRSPIHKTGEQRRYPDYIQTKHFATNLEILKITNAGEKLS